MQVVQLLLIAHITYLSRFCEKRNNHIITNTLCFKRVKSSFFIINEAWEKMHHRHWIFYACFHPAHPLIFNLFPNLTSAVYHRKYCACALKIANLITVLPCTPLSIRYHILTLLISHKRKIRKQSRLILSYVMGTTTLPHWISTFWQFIISSHTFCCHKFS